MNGLPGRPFFFSALLKATATRSISLRAEHLISNALFAEVAKKRF